MPTRFRAKLQYTDSRRNKRKNILNMLYQFVQNVIKHPVCTTGSLVNLTKKKDCMKTTCTMQMMKNKTSLSERKRVVDTRAKNDIDNRHVRYRSKGSLAIKDWHLHKVIGKFMKLTTSGCDHKVTISIKNGGKRAFLELGILRKDNDEILINECHRKVETTETNGIGFNYE
ncbi:unnamed protein product [Mytilus edulis]|uniref:Uncharacterized protein n=1 Tax=Mytilus edulis TaxID=6550 RepID=A0A8S3QW74_MYTED|nr:unnamed protein product [Mytilus edulis]